MVRKRYSDEDALKILREIDVHLHDGLDVVSAFGQNLLLLA
jgi:putative transposase